MTNTTNTPEQPETPNPLADLCSQCERSIHPDACPTAYVKCPHLNQD